MPPLEPTLGDIMNAISAHDQKFDKISKHFDDLIEVMQISFAHIDNELSDIRATMATKQDLEQTKNELRQEMKRGLNEVKQLGQRQQIMDRDLETTSLRLKHLEINL